MPKQFADYGLKSKLGRILSKPSVFRAVQRNAQP
jgi:hypothetical protein